ncbi:VWA-like domain-containing protein [Halomonas cibimaris]|uniref:VWA-like domain-containing protein n=1 Tax=Halomonas cibimaris TaxID=657012 RepID=A0ABP7LHY0_9GAMM
MAKRAPNAGEQQLKRRVQQTCEEDRAWLMTRQPFTARLMMQLNLIAVVDDRLPTAGTDGEAVFVNAEFMASRSDADRRFILAHEVWHCALGHHRRELGREPERWNHACDYEINALLKGLLGHCPDDALYHADFTGQSAEQIYARLSTSSRPPRGQTLDVHDLIGALSGTGEVNDPDFTPRPVSADNARRWQQRLIATAQQTERQDGKGSLPAHIRTLVEGLRRPEVPWQQVLAAFIQNTLGGSRRWLPPSRRHVYQGLYLPSLRSQTLSLAVALDTSGSCQRDLPHFLSELAGILGACDRVRLDVLEFDAQVARRTTLDESELYRLHQWECHGGGGSDIRPVFTVLETTPPDVLVAFTDGHIDALKSDPGYPVLWCLTPKGQKPTAWGDMAVLVESHVD